MFASLIASLDFALKRAIDGRQNEKKKNSPALRSAKGLRVCQGSNNDDCCLKNEIKQIDKKCNSNFGALTIRRRIAKRTRGRQKWDACLIMNYNSFICVLFFSSLHLIASCSRTGISTTWAGWGGGGRGGGRRGGVLNIFQFLNWQYCRN